MKVGLFQELLGHCVVCRQAVVGDLSLVHLEELTLH